VWPGPRGGATWSRPVEANLACVIDSGTLLTTCAVVGAAIVAIVGGLLVARFVTLDSAQEGADRRVAELETRLEHATGDARVAARQLLDHDLDYALDDEVVYEALIRSYNEDQSENPQAVVAMTFLRELTDLDGFTDSEVEPAIRQIAAEMTAALSHLRDLVPEQEEQERWRGFKRGRHLSVGNESVWLAAYEFISEARRSAARKVRSSLYGFNVPSLVGMPESALLGLGSHRRDARRRLQEFLDMAKAEESAVGRQLAIAVEDRARIIKPKGLISGLLVLAYLAAVSIVLPVLLLTPAPATLSDTQAIIVSSFFLSGIVVLFVYMGWLASRLRDGKP
jgi:hypothetical protein